jgi:soluble lytic murein transglycosylase-like protein
MDRGLAEVDEDGGRRLVAVGLVGLGAAGVIALLVLSGRKRKGKAALPTVAPKVFKALPQKVATAVGRRYFGEEIRGAATRWNVPESVLVTFLSLESSFKSDAYNPEVTAMKRWACQIAAEPRFRANPDYGNAASVCQTLTRDPGQAQLLAAQSKSAPYAEKSWKWGSFGLGQMSALTARTVGYPYEASNEDLFDPATNVELVARLLANLRKRLYPGRVQLSTPEWARVRAAYVGGPGIFQKAPGKAAEIASTFTTRAQAVA